MKKRSKRVQYILKKKFADLSSSEIKTLRNQGILNGFGGASQSWLVRSLIGVILVDFDDAIPDYHDFGYAVGGNETRRLECDEKFYDAMLSDVMKRYQRKEIGKFEFVGKSLVCACAFYTIRIRGSKFFFYS